MGDWQDWIGRSETREDVLTAGLVARHRATLNAPAGDAPLPGIHWCLCLPDAPMDALGEDGHPRRVGLPTGKAEDRVGLPTGKAGDNGHTPGGFLPPIALPRRMWASSKVEFLTPIDVGAAVRRTSTILSINEKSGSSGALAFVDIEHASFVGDKIAVREVQTLVYRAANAAAPAFIAPRGGAAELMANEWDEHLVLTPDSPQLFRYSALTFNSHRIHYDLPYAREVEGYAGLVVHGPLTASLLLQFATQRFGAIARFAFRGQSPAYCGEALTLVARRDGADIMLGALGPDGAMAMRAEASLN